MDINLESVKPRLESIGTIYNKLNAGLDRDKLSLASAHDIKKSGLNPVNGGIVFGDAGNTLGKIFGSIALARGAKSILGGIGRGLLGGIGGGLLGGLGGLALGALGGGAYQAISPWVQNTAMPWLNNIGQSISNGVSNAVADAKNWLENLYNEMGPQAAQQVQKTAQQAAKEVKTGKPGKATQELIQITKDPKIAEGMIQQMIQETNDLVESSKNATVPLDVNPRINIPTQPNLGLNVLPPNLVPRIVPSVGLQPTLGLNIPQPNFSLNISQPTF